MIESELLIEKYRVQKKLSGESKTIKEYLVNAHRAAEEIAKLHGFHLNYVEIPNIGIQRTAFRSLQVATDD